MSNSTRILFVCMGNICRSPSAEGVFRRLVAARGLSGDIQADSAGTHGYHVGHPPDQRASAAAAARGIDLSGIRARRVQPADFSRFDHVLAMDRANLRNLQALRAPDPDAAVPRLMLDYARNADVVEVPDPYFGGDRGFEYVLDLLEDACEGLLDAVLTSSAAR